MTKPSSPWTNDPSRRFFKVDDVFARKVSGVVQSMGFWDVVLFNLLGYGVGLSLATNPSLFGQFYPRANVALALLLGAILSLFFGMTHGLIGSLYPAEGGEIRFFYRIRLGQLGFVCNFLFTASQVFGAGVFSYWAITLGVAPAYWVHGVLTNSPAAMHWALHLSTGQDYAIGWGIVIVVLCCAGTLLPHTLQRILMLTAVIVGSVSSCLMVASFAGMTRQQFRARFDSFMLTSQQHASETPQLSPPASALPEQVSSQSVYDSILKTECGFSTDISASVEREQICDIQLYQAPKGSIPRSIAEKNDLGVSLGGFTWHFPSGSEIWESAKALPIAFLVFFGFSYSVYVGGEVKDPKKNQFRGIMWSFAAAVIISFVGFLFYFRAVGTAFNDACALYVNDQNISGVNFLPVSNSMVFMAGTISKWPHLITEFMGWGTCIWFIMLPFVMIRMCVSNLFAWGTKANVFPWLGVTHLNKKPLWALLVVSIFSIISIVAYAVLGFKVLNYSLLFSASFAVICFAATFIPWWKGSREDYALAQFRRKGIPWITFTGSLSCLMFALICFSVLHNPSMSGIATDNSDAGRRHASEFFMGLIFFAIGIWHWFNHGGEGARSQTPEQLPEDWDEVD